MNEVASLKKHSKTLFCCQTTKGVVRIEMLVKILCFFKCELIPYNLPKLKWHLTQRQFT